MQKLENAKSVRNTSNCLKIYLYDNERTFFVGLGGGMGLDLVGYAFIKGEKRFICFLKGNSVTFGKKKIKLAKLILNCFYFFIEQNTQCKDLTTHNTMT